MAAKVKHYYPKVEDLTPYRVEELEDLLCQLRVEDEEPTMIKLTKVEFSRLVLTAWEGASIANKKAVG